MDILQQLQKFITWVTCRRVLYISLLSIAAIVVLTAFEQRQKLWTSDDTELPRPAEHVRLKIKERSSDRMKQYVDSNPLVNLIVVKSASIRLNETDTVFSYSNDPVISYDLSTYAGKNGNVRPLFGSDDNFNASIVRTINGEFECYKNNALVKGVDDSRIASICHASVPPHYGQFAGFITVGTVRIPTQEERAEIRRILADISSNIFFDNVNR